jgi:hypothetical protein
VLENKSQRFELPAWNVDEDHRSTALHPISASSIQNRFPVIFPGLLRVRFHDAGRTAVTTLAEKVTGLNSLHSILNRPANV